MYQLLVHDVVVESMGGEVLSCNISAKTGEGISELKELIRLTNEILQLHADQSCLGEAFVLESRISKRGGGCVANILVRNGSIKVGQFFVCGLQYGKIRTIVDEHDRNINRPLLPGEAAQISGISSLEDITEDLFIVEDEEDASAIIAERRSLLSLDSGDNIIEAQLQNQLDQKAQVQKIQITRRKQRVALKPLTEEQEIVKKIKDNSIPVMVKADVSGSMDVLIEYFSKLPVDEVMCSVVKCSLGEVLPADIIYASEVGQNSIIVGFNVKASSEAVILAKQKGIALYLHPVIYSCWDDVRNVLSSKLPLEKDEIIVGEASVLQLFPVNSKKKSKTGGSSSSSSSSSANDNLQIDNNSGAMVAGCRVKFGKLDLKMKFKIIRNENTIFSGSKYKKMIV
jgi:translation initiation factor IF-2